MGLSLRESLWTSLGERLMDDSEMPVARTVGGKLVGSCDVGIVEVG